MMTEQSPEFRVSAFVQDITNLKATLEALGIPYYRKKTKIEVKDKDHYHHETIDIPEFQLHQFLGRVCMMLDELQSKFSVSASEGLVPHCKIHGRDIQTLCISSHAYCLRCIVADFECDWVDPENEMPEQKEKLS